MDTLDLATVELGGVGPIKPVMPAALAKGMTVSFGLAQLVFALFPSKAPWKSLVSFSSAFYDSSIFF